MPPERTEIAAWIQALLRAELDAPPPALRVVAHQVALQPTALILWRGGLWEGPMPVLRVAYRVRLSVASELTQVVTCGLQ